MDFWIYLASLLAVCVIAFAGLTAFYALRTHLRIRSIVRRRPSQEK